MCLFGIKRLETDLVQEVTVKVGAQITILVGQTMCLFGIKRLETNLVQEVMIKVVFKSPFLLDNRCACSESRDWRLI